MKAIIEIPKGDDRRRHLKYDKTGFIDLGPIKEKIPVNNGVMPIHYGYIPNTINKSEGDELDVLVISDRKFAVGEGVEIKPIAIIMRDDGDDKIVGVADDKKEMKEWVDIPEVDRNLILEFFGYSHKILSIHNQADATRYINDNMLT